MANWTPESRIEEILFDTINGEEYNGLPESRVEELLLELKEVIEEGGGGGGGTSTIAWKPSVALDGTISWTRTTSETKPDDQNIKGPKGDTGSHGPKGDTGETGAQGPKGDDGDPGLGIKQVSINLENHLIVTYDDDTTEDAGAIPGGSSTLSDLTDTAITSPTNGQVLTYNSTTSKWENADRGETKDTVRYEFVTKSTSGQTAAITVSKYLNDVLDSSTDYSYSSLNNNPTIIDGYISFVYKSQQTSWEYTILKDSLTGHSVGYSYSWSYSSTIDAEEEFYISEDTLAGLNDVAIVSPTASQPLTYDSANSMWVNGGIIPAANGGTGNTTGYVQAGRKTNTTIGLNATAEGSNTTASGMNSHAEGYWTQSTGNISHAEGDNSIASNGTAHAQNYHTTASGANSSSAGNYTVAGYQDQFVVGKFNDNKSTSIFEVGIGANANARANGLELDGSGNLTVAGDITDGDGNELGGKADKVVGATNGNFAGLDSNGNLIDSGKNASDFASASNVHSIPSGGTSGQVLAKSSGTDYDVSWVNAAGGGGTALWTSGATDAVTNMIPVTLSEPPALKAGNIVCLQIIANYTAQLVMADQSWGLQYIINGYTTNVSDCIFEVYSDSSNKVYFNDDLHKGDVLVLVVKEYTSGSKVFVVAAHKTEFEYTEQTVTLSTSSTTTVTFTSNRYTANSTVEVATSDWSVVPDSVTVTSGSCTVTLPAVSSARSIKVRIYNR